MAIQSFSEWKATQPTQAEPLAIKKETERRSLFSRGWEMAKRFSGSPVGRTIDYLLQAPEYVAAGITAETKGRVPTFQEISKGIGKGLKERITVPEALLKRGASPATAYGAGLPFSFLIPAVPIGKIAKATKVSGLARKGLGAIAEIPVPVSRLGRKVGELAAYRYGQPEEYVRLAEEAITGVRRGVERGVELAKPVTKLSSAEQKKIGQILTGEISTKLLKTTREKELAKFAKPIRDEFIRLGTEAVEEGLLDAKTFQANFGKYLPRMYRKHELPKIIRYLGFDKKPIRIDLSRFKKRMDIPEDVRRAMGEITEAGYPTARGVGQLVQAITRAKLFRIISENSEWVSKTAKEGFEKLPDTKTLGKLRRMYVSQPIADDIQQMIATRSPATQLLNKITGWWKYGKVVVNPATISRNLMSNVILAHTIGELNPSRIDIYIDALADLAKKGESYKEAKKMGLLGKTFYGAEIKGMLDVVQEGGDVPSILGKTLRKFGNFYQASEEWFKLAVFKYHRGLGKTAEKAAAIAEEALFDYSKIPQSIRTLRSSIIGVPFITFGYKAMPALAKAFVEHPTRFAQYQRIFKAIEGLTPEDIRKKEEEVKPEWMKKFGRQYLRLPVKDKYGRTQYFDLSYILPWFGFAGLKPFSHPVASLFNDLVKNKDYFGNEIYSPTDDENEKYKKITKHIWKQLVPTFPALPGTYSFDKLESAIKKTPDYLGRTRGMGQTILDVFFGIKTYPFDIKEQKRWRKYEKEKAIGEIKAELKRTLKKKGISSEEKRKARDKAKEKIRKLQEGE